MKLESSTGELAHLTYCSNIHPGESWPEVAAALAEHIPQVRRELDFDGAFGLGLRLSALAARALRDPATLESFRAWMHANDAYVFTFNGFPYGPFHGTPVKEAVYRPDWSTPQRAAYTLDLIDTLAAIIPDGISGSISTVPGSFRFDPAASDPTSLLEGLVTCALRCWHWRETGGLDLSIGLEPEPMCMLETTDEAIRFFEDTVFSTAARSLFAARSGCTSRQSEEALRRHLGVCFDTCHAAVEFEDPGAGARRLRAAGIRISKVQVTAGLELRTPTAAGIEQLEAFAEDTYLHQVVIKTDRGLVRVLDLPEALERWREGSIAPGPWRVHLHVPVFSRLMAPLSATTEFIASALPELRTACTHFEVETYTWSVLPPTLRGLSRSASIARELQWTRALWHSP
ncbi:MAG: metabolite traffic protein EboE [Nannocystales bacterium]